MSFRPAAAPAPRIAAAAAPPPPPRQRRSGLFSDAITLRPGVVIPRSAPTGGDARPAMESMEAFMRRVQDDRRLTDAQKAAALATEERRRMMITRMNAHGAFLSQYDVAGVPLEVRPVANLEEMYESFKVWEADQARNLAPIRAPALAGDELLHRAYAGRHPPADEHRRMRLGDEFHPGHGPDSGTRAAFAPSLAREESATGGVMDKIKAGVGDALRSAKAAVDLKGAYTLNCLECKDRGDPPSLDAIAFTDRTTVEGVAVPVVVMAVHKQWKDSKTTPGFSVPKVYHADGEPYVMDFVEGKRGNPSGRFPFPPTASSKAQAAHALQSFRDLIFAAGMQKATYLTSLEDEDTEKDAAKRSAMGRGHPAAVVDNDGDFLLLKYPYSCVYKALKEGGKGGLLQYVSSTASGKPAHEKQPSVLPHPDNDKIREQCTYTAMAAVWIPYDLPRLWSRYACILVPIGANNAGQLAMGHAIFVPHKEYGVMAPPTDPSTGKLRPWTDPEALAGLEAKYNHRGDRGTRGGNARLPGYDLLGAYAIDSRMAGADGGSGEDPSPMSEYGPRVTLASEELIVPYLGPSVAAFVVDISDDSMKTKAERSIAENNQAGALIELNKTFRTGMSYASLNAANPGLTYRQYADSIVEKVAAFKVDPPHIYDYAMLDTAARAARALFQSKNQREGLALGLGALLAGYGARKKEAANAQKTLGGKLTLQRDDYERKTGAGFSALEQALEDLWDFHEREDTAAAWHRMARANDVASAVASADDGAASSSESEGGGEGA